LRLEYRLADPPFQPIALLPGSETSFLWTPPPAPYVVFRLLATTSYWTVEDSALLDLTGVQGGDLAPGTLTLEQNYPNPFNPGTTIRFTLSQSSDVTLKVFDILGREVATLVAGHLPPGTHQREWNPGNTAAGVYFCRLRAGESVETRKLVLLR